MSNKYPNTKIFCTRDFNNLPDINSENESVCGHRYPSIINELAIDMSVECGLLKWPNSAKEYS